MMPQLKYLIVAAALLLTPILGSTDEKSEKHDNQGIDEVLIVQAGLYDEDGVSITKAISLIGDKQIARLLAMFPNCCSRPESSDPPAGYETEYVIFLFLKQDVVRLSVGSNAKLWSAGIGDFETQGDFRKFLKELKK